MPYIYLNSKGIMIAFLINNIRNRNRFGETNAEAPVLISKKLLKQISLQSEENSRRPENAEVSPENQYLPEGAAEMIGLSRYSLSVFSEYISWKHYSYFRNVCFEMKKIINGMPPESAGEEDLHLIKSNFFRFTEILVNHLEKKETLLFPLLRSLESNYIKEPSIYAKIEALLVAAEQEMENADHHLRILRTITYDYFLATENDSESIMLHKFFSDLDMRLTAHIKLERILLFKKIRKAIKIV
jgi:iron-sulfur cluster repair protein YtfE (RIC family)